MARPQVENLITSQVKKQKWTIDSAPPGTTIRVLNEDKENGELTALLDLPAGANREWSVFNTVGQEFFVLEGSLRIGSVSLTPGCYCYYPAGVVQGPWVAEESCSVIAF